MQGLARLALTTTITRAGPLPVVLVRAFAFRDNRSVDPSPRPWTFHSHVYGLSNALLDRDGRVISCHLAKGNGALIAKAPRWPTS